MSYLSGAYFDVFLIGPGGFLSGKFTAVSGLNMEVEYEIYNEGGANYPRYFLKEVKPQTLVLERGVITGLDSASLLMLSVNLGMSIPMSGIIKLKDSFDSTQRIWSIEGAHLQKYIGPELNSNQPALAVTRIELLHNGCI